MNSYDFRDELRINLRIKKQKRLVILLISFILVLILGATDYISGYEMSFSIFYLIPISFAVIFSDFKSGFIVSILSAISWFLADYLSGHKYHHFLTPYWNALMRLGYFLLHSFFLSKFLILYNKAKIDSFTDSLTSICNARYFYELFERELKKAKRLDKPFTLAYIDIDNFKEINDIYGHIKGDLILKNFSNLVLKNLREYDIIARVGGDEFVILLPDIKDDSANDIISRIKEVSIKEFQKDNYSLSLSIGAITYKKFDKSIEAMLKEVDDLMYEVKKSGKNNVMHKIYEK